MKEKSDQASRSKELIRKARTVPVWLKTLLSIISLFIFLAILEFGLRSAGYALIKRRNADLEPKPASTTRTIICIGDSFTYGGEGSRKTTYPYQLNKALSRNYPQEKFRVVNLGICEANTWLIHEHLPAWLEKYQPEMVIFLAGSSNRFTPMLFFTKDQQFSNFWSETLQYRVVKIGLIIWLSIKREILNWKMDYLTEVKNALNRKEYEKVINYCLQAIEDDPSDPEMYYIMTKTFELQSHYTSSMVYKRLSELIRDHPELAREQIFTSYLSLYENKNRYEKLVDQKTVQDLEEIAELCQSKGVQLIMQNYPIDYPMANDSLRKTAAKYNLPFVDNLSYFNKLSPKSRYLLDDDHCTLEGHAMMVESIINVLEENRLILPKIGCGSQKYIRQ